MLQSPHGKLQDAYPHAYHMGIPFWQSATRLQQSLSLQHVVHRLYWNEEQHLYMH